MKALSVKLLWAWAILCAGQRVHNREWWKARNLVTQARRLAADGSPVLLHAGADRGAADYWTAARLMEKTGRVRVRSQEPWMSGGSEGLPALPTRREAQLLPHGAVVARVRIGAVIASDHEFRSYVRRYPEGEGQRVWWWGRIALAFVDIEPFAVPIPCKGSLGFFNVPEHLVEGAAP